MAMQQNMCVPQTWVTGTLTGTFPSTSEPAPQRVLDSHIRELGNVVDYVSELCGRLQRMADRMLGAVPTNIATAKEHAPLPAGEPPINALLEQRMSSLQGVLSLAHEQIARLERF